MNLRLALLTAFGIGRLRPFPGTWGSAPAAAFAVLMVGLLGPTWTVDVAIALFGLVFFIACVRFGHEAEQLCGRKDPGDVVADELAGQSLTLLFLPWWNPVSLRAWLWNIAVATVAFAIFRVMDVIKPPPIRSMQRFHGGWGIVVDDVLAGLLALVVTQLVVRYIGPMIAVESV